MSTIIKFKVYYFFSNIKGPFWLCRLSRPKNPKYSPTSIEVATGDLRHRLIIEAECEEHADIFASRFRKCIALDNASNMNALNALLASVGVFNSSDQHWKDLNESREFNHFLITSNSNI